MRAAAAMMVDAKAEDPRTIITPDAFHVARHLLGLPTAPPWRRLAAMLIDLVLIAVLSNAPAFLLALAVAALLLRLAFGRGAGAARRVRGTLGCLGVAALAIGGGIVWLAREGGPEVAVPLASEAGGAEGVALRLSLADLHQALSSVSALGEASTDSAARDAAERLVALALERGVEPQALADLLAAEMPTEAGGERAARALAAAVRAAAPADEDAGVEPPGTGRVAPVVVADTLLAVWRAAVAAGDSVAAERARRALAAEVAAPELRGRDGRIRSLERREEERRRRVAELEDELEEARRGPGILTVARSVADDLGLGLGWSGLYFTVFLVLWKGRTPGKRLLGIRVLRLDGSPIGWWPSFERFGGYAASLLTGLLGFAEILWDRNRQALHDRIARTVVVRDVAVPVARPQR